MTSQILIISGVGGAGKSFAGLCFFFCFVLYVFSIQMV